MNTEQPTDDVLSLAERWVKCWRFDNGESTEDCEACDGEAVPADAILAHEEVCRYSAHDVLDDGGGKCLTCEMILPACPVCGPYHGRQSPPHPLDDQERERLLGWVRQRMATVNGIPSAVADAIAADIGLSQQQSAALCVAATEDAA